MKTKIISKSIAFGVCQIELALNRYYAERKVKTVDIFLDACREIAAANTLDVDFRIVEQFADPGVMPRRYNQIQAVFRDIGSPR